MNGAASNHSVADAVNVFPNILVSLSHEEGETAISKFQRFLQFETVSSSASVTGAYVECAKFLMEELQSLGFLSDIHLLPEAPDHSPVVVACWKGLDETLPVLLLNSHYDVVPALRDDWTVNPFEGMRRDGKIYGRGSQDMKCVCLQYIFAIQKIHNLDPDWKPARSIYLTYVPNEETGGDGMKSRCCSLVVSVDVMEVVLCVLSLSLSSTYVIIFNVIFMLFSLFGI
jgi:acetylornithine deacetylase/succinyl-diaminopimelate desuccinylase-like protein